MSADFKEIVLNTLETFFEPISDIKSEEDLLNFFDFMGWEPNNALVSSSSAIFNQIETIVSAIEIIKEIIEDPSDSVDILPDAIEAAKDLIENFIALPDHISGIDTATLEKLPEDFLNTLLILYLVRRQPILYGVMEILSIVRKEEINHIVENGSIIKGNNVIAKVDWSIIPDLITNPLQVFEEYYWPNGFSDIDETNKVAKKIFLPISSLLRSLGFVTMFGRGTGPEELDAGIESRMEGYLSVSKTFSIDGEAENTSDLGITFGLISENEEGPGVLMIPFGNTHIESLIGEWLLIFDIALAAGGIRINKNGLTIFENVSDNAISAGFSIGKLPSEDSSNSILIGSESGTHFAVRDFWIKTEIMSNTKNLNAGAYIIFNGIKLQISGGDGDGFLSTVLGDGINAEFDLEIGYSTVSGFHFKGSGGLVITFPTHIEIGPIGIENLQLGLSIEATGLKIAAGASVKVELGPFIAVVEGMGLKTDLTFPDGGGNLGPADLAFGFKPPTGIGLSLDTGVVKGGGYLFFDTDNERYGGALELEIQETLLVTAIGLITTRMPDGSKGFSLLLMINVQFTPGIVLGMGFFLSGLGGLIGINRTVEVEVLRQGVRQGGIDHIMFPEDVVENISRIITDLRAIFPPKEDQFIIGLMAKITWGVPTLISIEFGLLVEFASPVRIAILGVIKAVIPTEEAAILKLQVNFLGVIDFEKGELSFDASLEGSRILAFTLEGDMALRLSWGEKKAFVLSVGGFHPSFNPPAHLNLGDMKRLTLTILSGNPNLVLTSYFALTSNTVQFGAAIDFSFSISKFSVIGYFGFDVLFQFSPFRFIAGIRAGIEVKLGSSTLFAITLDFELQGPTPWVASGTASFKILFIKIKVRFNETWGERNEVMEATVPVLPKVLDALTDPSNWSAAIASTRNLLVTLKENEVEEEFLLLQSMGSLKIDQTIVPLDLLISKYGNNRPEDIKKVKISEVRIEGSTMEIEKVKDTFVPASYKEMEDEDKLSSPSYVDEYSGVQTKSTDVLHMDYAINRAVVYEQRTSDYNRASETPYALYTPNLLDPWEDSATMFTAMTKGGAIGKSPLSRKRKEQREGLKTKVVLEETPFSIMNTYDLQPVYTLSFEKGTQSEADQALKELLQEQPTLKGKLQIVPTDELEEVV